MKKFLIAFVLLAGGAVVAYASFSNKKKTDTANQKKDCNKECSGHKCCMYSL